MARKLTRRAKKALNRKKFREARRRATSSSSRRGKSKRRSKRKLSKKDWIARRIQTGRDYVAYKKSRSEAFGPVPFELQPSWLRAKAGKKFRSKRARWAKARSSR